MEKCPIVTEQATSLGMYQTKNSTSILPQLSRLSAYLRSHMCGTLSAIFTDDRMPSEITSQLVCNQSAGISRTRSLSDLSRSYNALRTYT